MQPTKSFAFSSLLSSQSSARPTTLIAPAPIPLDAALLGQISGGVSVASQVQDSPNGSWLIKSAAAKTDSPNGSW